MNAFVAITDRDWFDFLAGQEEVDEVNFWHPSAGGGRFRALGRGEAGVRAEERDAEPAGLPRPHRPPPQRRARAVGRPRCRRVGPGPHPSSPGAGHVPGRGPRALRSDVHRLFDAGYITVTLEYRVEASGRMKEDFDDGENYLRLHGAEVRVPGEKEMRPSGEALRWHNENRFKG